MIKFILIFYSLFALDINSSAILDIINPVKDAQNVIVSSDITEKKLQLKLLLEERNQLEAQNKDFVTAIEKDLEKINNQIKQKEKLLESDLPKEEKRLINESLALLRDNYQTLNEILITKQSIKNSLDTEINLIEDYLKDPTFSSYKIEQQSYFSYEYLYDFLQKLLFVEENLKQFEEQKNSLEAELESKKRDLLAIEKDIRDKEKEQKKFLTNDVDKETLQQRAQLLDLNKELLKSKRRLFEKQIKEINTKLSVLNLKMFINQSRYNLLKPGIKIVERRLRVYESDLEKINKEINDIRKEISEAQKDYNSAISKLSEEKNEIEAQIKEIINTNGISQELVNSISNWSLSAKDISPQTELIYYQLGNLLEKELRLDLEIDLYKVQKEFHQNKLQKKELTKSILQAWQKITQNKLNNSDALEETKDFFDNLSNEISRDTSFYKERINHLTNQINKQAAELNAIKDRIEAIKSRNADNESHNELLSSLLNAEEEISNQLNINSEEIKLYSSMIASNRDSEKQLILIINMIDKIGGSVLFRSEYAISSKSLKSIRPEFRIFLSDLKNIIYSNIKNFNLQTLRNATAKPVNVLIFLIKLLALLVILTILYTILRASLPMIANRALKGNPSSRILSFLYEVFGVMLLFCRKHLKGLLVWLAIFTLIKINVITRTDFQVMFFLISIPYLCYLAYSFFNFLIVFNRNHNYSILSEHFQKRFYKVFLFLSISTICIFLFKEAFLASTYGKTELPRILDAVYSIILRACIIFLIGKEEMLSLIPESNDAWIWVKDKIGKLYYFILAAILALIIVSDPYIGGFGKLVSYVLWGIILTLILLALLSWLQVRVRKLSANIFFESDDESRQERFPHAKTIYGIFIVVVFIAFFITALYLGTRIWGRPISFDSITNALDFKLFAARGEDNQFVPITVGSLLTVVLFIIGGLIVSWIFEHFVLQKVFNVLLVDTGIQNTVSSISSYLIFIVIIIVGLMRIGVSGTTLSYFLGAIAVAIAFAIKGPANDFISYFIILVERSIKIGDFVEFPMSNQLMISGVIRKITPRTIVLRRNNSVTLIVPNSTVTNSTFYNWSYSNTFFAFDDIFLTVAYDCDPQRVKEILLSVLDKNKEVLKSPTPIVRLDRFDDHGFVFMARGFLSSVNILKKWDIASDVRLSIVKALRENNIKLAVPVRIMLSSDKSLNLPEMQAEMEK